MRKSNSLEGGLEDDNQAVNLFDFKFTGTGTGASSW